MHRIRRGEAGATLLELTVVLALVGMAVVAVVPVVGTALDASKTRAAATQVASVLRVARQAALSSRASYRVTMSGEALHVACQPGVPAGNVCPANRPPDATYPLLAGPQLTLGTDPVIFGPTGAATTGTILITQDGAESWEVAVSAAGRVRSCSPACS